MKKLFAIAIAASIFSGLYGLSFGLGGVYDMIAGPEGTDPYFGVRADVMCQPMPIFGFRIGLVQVDLPEDNTTYTIGTGLGSDLVIFVPMAGLVSPYIPLGVEYYDYGELVGSGLNFRGGLGAGFGFGGFAGYLEGGIRFFMPGEGDSQNWFYAQAGIRVPVAL